MAASERRGWWPRAGGSTGGVERQLGVCTRPWVVTLRCRALPHRGAPRDAWREARGRHPCRRGRERPTDRRHSLPRALPHGRRSGGPLPLPDGGPLRAHRLLLLHERHRIEPSGGGSLDCGDVHPMADPVRTPPEPHPPEPLKLLFVFVLRSPLTLKPLSLRCDGLPRNTGWWWHCSCSRSRPAAENAQQRQCPDQKGDARARERGERISACLTVILK